MPRRKSSVKANKKTVEISNFQYYWEKLNSSAESNQSKLSMILGALIILVIGILVFNYFNQPKPSLGPSQQIKNNQQDKYTVKEGDTLFSISEKYYQDGYKYQEIAKSNNLENPDSLEVGQILDIPKLSSTATPQVTSWGPAISGDTYTIEEGDWLSTIAGRAYGDIYSYKKIADANNISDPDLILPGQVLTIPR